MMDIEDVQGYCLGLKGVEESLPFGPDVLVFKVGQKIFALLPLYQENVSLNLKCDPERAVILRDQYDAIVPGYHMNKKHWNTLHVEQLPSALVKELILHSYDLVVKSLPKAVQHTLTLKES
jgi:predicted DNA-binding protein (MmcQ/YjbR family)